MTGPRSLDSHRQPRTDRAVIRGSQGVADGISGSADNPDPLGLTAQHAERIGERGNQHSPAGDSQRRDERPRPVERRDATAMMIVSAGVGL